MLYVSSLCFFGFQTDQEFHSFRNVESSEVDPNSEKSTNKKKLPRITKKNTFRSFQLSKSDLKTKQTQHKHPKNPDQTSQPKGLFGLAMLATTRWFVASSQLLQLFWARLDRGGVIYFASEKFHQTWNQASEFIPENGWSWNTSFILGWPGLFSETNC